MKICTICGQWKRPLLELQIHGYEHSDHELVCYSCYTPALITRFIACLASDTKKIE